MPPFWQGLSAHWSPSEREGSEAVGGCDQLSARTPCTCPRPCTYQRRRPRRDPARQDEQRQKLKWRHPGDAKWKAEEQLTVRYESWKKALACSYEHTFSMHTCSRVEPAALRFWRWMSELACCLSTNTARREGVRFHNGMEHIHRRVLDSPDSASHGTNRPSKIKKKKSQT